MLSKGKEIWWSLFSIILISLVYLYVLDVTGSIPAAGEFFGHSLGIIGFTFMLMTEVLYSLRKNSNKANWGRMSTWLQFHIYTGLVGPYMVLLHTSWKFNGIAGIVMLMTIIVVVSGIIGRYIFTSIPRNADGKILETFQIENRINQINDEINDNQNPLFNKFLGNINTIELSGNPNLLILNRFFNDFKTKFSDFFSGIKLSRKAKKQYREVNRLVRQKQKLEFQIRTLSASRKLLALWHIAHVPFGIVMFVTSFFHIVGAIYYSTLLH